MAKLVMVGEEHTSKKMKGIGRAVKERVEKHKPSRFALLVEGPFMLPLEKAVLEVDLPLIPTEPIWKFLQVIKGEKFDSEKEKEEKLYLEMRDLQDYREIIENIESPVFIILPQAANFGVLEKIDVYEKKYLGTLTAMINVINLRWEKEFMQEHLILNEYREIAALSLEIRSRLNELEKPVPGIDILRLTPEEIENIGKILANVPPKVLDDILMLFSKMHSTFGMRSGLHVNRMLEHENADLIITATGAGHIPGVLRRLEKEEKLGMVEELVFTGEPKHKEYAESALKTMPGLKISYI